MKKQEKLMIVSAMIITICAIIIGLVFNSDIISILLLVIGFLNAYFMSQGKWYTYYFGIIYSLLYAIVSFANGLYGVVILTILFYEPMQIMGLINWINNKGDNHVLTKSLQIKQGLLFVAFMIITSFAFGYSLEQISTQNFAFLDSTSQILNISANILIILRYKECWEIWIFGSILDLCIWLLCFINKSEYSVMMLVVSIMYVFMNIYGYITWSNFEKQRLKSEKKEMQQADINDNNVNN